MTKGPGALLCGQPLSSCTAPGEKWNYTGNTIGPGTRCAGALEKLCKITPFFLPELPVSETVHYGAISEKPLQKQQVFPEIQLSFFCVFFFVVAGFSGGVTGNFPFEEAAPPLKILLDSSGLGKQNYSIDRLYLIEYLSTSHDKSYLIRGYALLVFLFKLNRACWV